MALWNSQVGSFIRGEKVIDVIVGWQTTTLVHQTISYQI